MLDTERFKSTQVRHPRALRLNHSYMSTGTHCSGPAGLFTAQFSTPARNFSGVTSFPPGLELFSVHSTSL